jgi:primase-polymerase (primpol)-like protein
MTEEIRLEDVPEALRALPQWVVWRYQQRDGATKSTKVPFTCQGFRASVTNPEHWSCCGYALAALRRPGFCDGIGFVFTAEDPFCGIDLDNVWSHDAAETPQWAQGVLDRFADSYGEGSPSDTGYKIWCRARARRGGKWRVHSGAIEIYDHARFFTFTGRSNGVMEIADHQSDIDSLVAWLDEDDQGAPPRAVTIPERIRQGSRHNTLVSVAGTMWRRGLIPEVIEAALIAMNEQQCEPPYDREHIRQIVRSMAGWAR